MPSSGKRSSRPVGRRSRKVSRRRSSADAPGPGAWFDAAAADRACQFIELFLTHSKGEWAGRPFKLDAWQRDRIIRPLFGWKRPDGFRWYSRCDLWLPRKNGKSALAAAVALFGLFADNEPGAQVYLCANDRDQASIVFKDAAAMVAQSPELREMSNTYDSARTKAIIVPETMSSLQAVSKTPTNKDGLNPSTVVFDEIHEMKDARFWAKMTTGSSARNQPLFFVISTAGADRNTIGYREYQADKRILAGKSRIKDRLVVIYEADRDDDWKSPKTWRKCNPGFGVSVKESFLRSMAAEAAEDPAKENDFKRYHLNIWVSAVTGWLALEKWDACDTAVDIFGLAQVPCWIGLDLAMRSDITAAVALFKHAAENGGEPTYSVLPHFWVPQANIDSKEQRDGVPYREWSRLGLMTLTPGDVTDYPTIKRFILERWAPKFAVQEISYDKFNAMHLVSELQDAGLTMVEFPQTITHVAPPTMELKNLVLQGRLRHGGNPILRWMVENVAVISDVNGNQRLSKKASNARIDGLAALVNALGRASVAESTASVYQQRGIIEL